MNRSENRPLSEVWSPLPLHLLHPPYDNLECAGFVSAPCVGGLSPGALLVLEAAQPERHWATLREQVPRLRSAFPACPLVLLTGESSTPELLDCVRRMGVLRVRAVVSGDAPAPGLLRSLLTDPVDLGDDVVEWLYRRGLAPSPALAEVIRRIFGHAASGSGLDELLRAMGEPASTVRRRFRAESLPSPWSWLEVARAVHAALRLQREPAASVLAVAVGAGYSDHSALSHRTFRLFGLRPGRIRELLGWEWLLECWVRRAIVRPAAPAGR